MSIALIGWLTLPWKTAFLLGMALCLALVWQAYANGLDAAGNLRLDDNGWMLEAVDGSLQPVELLPGGFCSAWLLVLPFRHPVNGQRRVVWLTPWRYGAQAYRAVCRSILL